MFEDILEKVFLAMSVLAAGLIIFILTILVAVVLSGDLTKKEPNISNAQPIAQQQIGDGVNPDILIIYEAKVDGETVYPSVIKENK